MVNERPIDKLMPVALIAMALLFLILAIFPVQSAAAFQLLTAPLRLGDPDRSLNGDYLHNSNFQHKSTSPASGGERVRSR